MWRLNRQTARSFLLTLFDHQTAETQYHSGWRADLKLLLLESPDVVLTEDFHKRDRRAALLAREPLLAQAWKLLYRRL